jgi:hypothetical protein
MKSRSRPLPQASKSGPAVLWKWIRAHFLFKSSLLGLALYAILPAMLLVGHHPYRDRVYWALFVPLYSGLYFAGVTVTQKLEPLPMSRRRVYRYLAIPSLGLLVAGVFLVELLRLDTIFRLTSSQKDVALIRYELSEGLPGEEFGKQLLIPPQMLQVVTGEHIPSVRGPNDNAYNVPSLPLSKFGGPKLYNPYFVPPFEAFEEDAELTSFQLQRALTELYGASPSAEEIRQKFFLERGWNRRTFNNYSFEEWQREWRQSHPGKFQTVVQYWLGQTWRLMPVRALGWVLGWGTLVLICFTFRAAFRSRIQTVLQKGLAYGFLAAVTVQEFGMFGRPALWVETDGFRERSRLFLQETLREYLPGNSLLAWLVVFGAVVVVYQLGYLAYRNTEWPQIGQGRDSKAKDREKEWQDV